MQADKPPSAKEKGITAALKLADFDFELPADRIAQVPAERRDAARLLVVDRQTGALRHDTVAGLGTYLRAGDLLVANDTKVLPARLFGTGPGGGGIELLLVRRAAAGASTWLCIGRPVRRLRPGAVVALPGNQQATVRQALGEGRYLVEFPSALDVHTYLGAHGELPLPPYIRRPDGLLPSDPERYQTVFATHPGAIAAPTAGLHFTPALLETLEQSGVELARLTLHVGPGTFSPIRDGEVAQHTMEAEWIDIPASTAVAIRRAKAAGRRVIAIGTTTTRALESAATGDATVLRYGEGWASSFIVPGHSFRVVDALFTNFHLPGSTLLLLVAALLGRDTMLEAYRTAVAEGYRFYSYGDAMFIA